MADKVGKTKDFEADTTRETTDTTVNKAHEYKESTQKVKDSCVQKAKGI